MAQRARAVLTSKPEAPLLWRTAIAAYLAMALGAYLSWIAGFQPPKGLQLAWSVSALPQKRDIEYELLVVGKVIPAALVALFVVLLGVSVPRRRTRGGLIVAIAVGLLSLAAMYLAWIAVMSPWILGPVMALVMGLGALATGMGKAIGGIASLFGAVFFLYSVCGLDHGLTGTDVLVQASIGAGAGVAVIILIWLVRVTTGFRLVTPPKLPPKDPAAPKTARPSAKAVLADHRLVRYALLRAVLVGVGAGIYAANKQHNLFWVLLTVWVVLQPAPDATRARGLQRIVGVMAGCLIVAFIAQFATPDIVVIIGLTALFVGVLWYQRNWAVYVAGVSMLTVALHGEVVHYSFEAFAGWRALDTAIGIAVGFAAYFLVVTLPDRRAKAKQAAAQ